MTHRTSISIVPWLNLRLGETLMPLGLPWTILTLLCNTVFMFAWFFEASISYCHSGRQPWTWALLSFCLPNLELKLSHQVFPMGCFSVYPHTIISCHYIAAKSSSYQMSVLCSKCNSPVAGAMKREFGSSVPCVHVVSPGFISTLSRYFQTPMLNKWNIQMDTFS